MPQAASAPLQGGAAARVAGPGPHDARRSEPLAQRGQQPLRVGRLQVGQQDHQVVLAGRAVQPGGDLVRRLLLAAAQLGDPEGMALEAALRQHRHRGDALVLAPAGQHAVAGRPDHRLGSQGTQRHVQEFRWVYGMAGRQEQQRRVGASRPLQRAAGGLFDRLATVGVAGESCACTNHRRSIGAGPRRVGFPGRTRSASMGWGVSPDPPGRSAQPPNVSVSRTPLAGGRGFVGRRTGL